MTKQEEIKKTSEDWSKDYKTKVIDPDGWDRYGDFNYSWYKELITREEFYRRLCISTCEMYIEDGNLV